MRMIGQKCGAISLTDEQIREFWSLVEFGSPSVCWLWKGDLKPNSGRPFYKPFRKLHVKDIAYFICRGNHSKDGVICHLCNERLCVNPHHLYLGVKKKTYKEIMESNLHESKKGFACYSLRKTHAREIRKRFTMGESKLSLSERYGIRMREVDQILRGIQKGRSCVST